MFKKISIGVYVIVLIGFALSLILFSVSYAMEGFFRPSVGKIKESPPGDGRVSVTEGGALLLYDENGKVLSGFPVFAVDSVFVTSPLLLDMYGDGMKEIAVVVRDVADVYSVYLYNGIGELIAQDSLGEKSVYYDLAVLKSGVNNKKNFVLITEDGSVLEYSLIDGSLVSQEIFSIGYAGSIAVNNVQNKIYVSPLNAKIINIYSKVNEVWGITSSIATLESIIYPIEESNNGRIFAINYNGELVAYNITDGQLVAGFPVTFDFMPVISPIISELDSNSPGTELVILLSNGRFVLLNQNGVILNDNFSQGSFLSTKIKILGAGPDETSPELVSNLTAGGLEDGISLNWDLYANTDSDFNHFNIYRNTTSTQSIDLLQPIKQINDVNVVNYIDDDVEIGEEYYYTITVVDNADNESDPVDWVGPVHLAVNVPPVVADVEIYQPVAGGNIELSYNLSDENGQDVQPIIDWRLNNQSLLMLNMPFDGGKLAQDNTMVKDYSLNGNNGNVVGATYNPTGGHNNTGAYYFSGAPQEYIKIPGLHAIDNKYTVSLWIKPGSHEKRELFFNFGGSTGLQYADLRPDNSVLYIHGANAPFTRVISKNKLVTEQWNHMVITWDGTKMLAYINGQLDGAIQSGTSPVVMNNDTYIGSFFTSIPFKGLIDDVSIYNRAISPEQASLLSANELDTIASQETKSGENWQACVTPNDGKVDGEMKCSNELPFDSGNYAPTQNDPVLEQTVDKNLVVTPQGLSDADGDNISSIIDWRLNNQSLLMLNMPFDGGKLAQDNTMVKDYSLNGNNGNVVGATYDPTGGHNNTGAYYFSGAPQEYIKIPGLHAIDNKYTVSLWIKPGSHEKRELFFNFGGSTGLQYADLKPDNSVMYIHGASPFTRVTTKNKLITDQWNHLVITWNGTKMLAYINGQLDGAIQSGTAPVVMNNDTYIGSFFTSIPFKGLIDDVSIYNRAISPEQASLLSANELDTIASQETKSGENWQACVTPNDGKMDGAEKCTEIKTIE